MRYFLAQDESSHWYMIREDKREEWVLWAEAIDNDLDPGAYEGFAVRLPGYAGSITFEKPELDGEALEIIQ